jgi:hypothetical protein
LTGELIVIPNGAKNLKQMYVKGWILLSDIYLLDSNIQLNELTGNFPDSLFEFEDLEIITLNANVSEDVQAGFYGSISDRIGNLKNLRNLYVVE